VYSGGAGARITLTYAESLYDAKGNKLNRNEIEGKRIRGVHDEVLADGGNARLFRPLWFRAFRYIEIQVNTAAAVLTLDELRGDYTGYPFTQSATFASSDEQLSAIWRTGWRTARLCAGETYYDCPYYEQLQYVGDTRIQALISLYNSGDDRLMRNAIELLDNSRLPEGLTQSRYPASTPQIIPPFSLFWIDMLHDYWMHRDDRAFVARYLTGIENVLEFHLRRQARSGMLGRVEWWNFVDWPSQWPWDQRAAVGGVPALGADGGDSSILSLQLVYALDRAAELMEAYDRPALATRYRAAAEQLKHATYRLCWDAARGLLADTPAKREFSQHANAMAALVHLLPAGQERALMERVVNDPSLIQCTVYYRFYLYRAMKAVGLGDRYVEMLAPWRAMIDLGLSTFAEQPEPTRSDCHAWSASPNYELLASVAGIEPSRPGFAAVRIAPNLGPLTWVKASMPHPRGTISVDLRRAGQAVKGSVTLPPGLAGDFVWHGHTVALGSGRQSVDLP
jgi:hypothetical protein